MYHDGLNWVVAAAALADGGRSSIVNATDSDWSDVADALEELGIQVENLL